VAGTDSVVVTMRMAILYILSAPHIYNKIMLELDTAKSKGLASSSLVRDAETKGLPYLQAIIRESLRIFPPQTPLLNKEVPRGGDIVAGYRLPAGTQIGMDGWGILRSKAHWGEDADIFRPERWLEVDETRYSEMSACLDALFGYGRYKCLGRGIAMMQLSKGLPEVS
jgi:cytochrome P450